MSRRAGGPVEVTVGQMRVLAGFEVSSILDVYRQHAQLVEDFVPVGDHGDEGYLFVAVTDVGEWPGLVVTQRFAPAGPGFTPGVLLVAEQRQVFIGAGTRLLAYDCRPGRWRRCWQDHTEVGFWGWCRYGDVVVMSAELELAAWTTDGTKLWATFVEPPWSYRVDTDRVTVDVMGTTRTFGIRTGP